MFPWQAVFDSHVFQNSLFSVLINTISMVYGIICVLSLSLAKKIQIRYNLAYTITISVIYLN